MAIIDKYQDVMDSRDIIERIEELESLREEAIEAGENLDDMGRAWGVFSTGEQEELVTLKALAEEASGSPDWQYGETLIRDSYFEEYAQELAEECGMIPDGLSWPMTYIDWKQAARELQYHYISVDFDGVTYWIRA